MDCKTLNMKKLPVNDGIFIRLKVNRGAFDEISRGTRGQRFHLVICEVEASILVTELM